MEQWIEFVKDEWWVLLIALLALIIVLKVLKTVFKWVIVLAIVAGVIYYGSSYADRLEDAGGLWKDVGGQLLNYALEEVFEVMAGEAASATYTLEPDGSYKVVSERLTIAGKTGEDKVTITYKGQSFSIKINDVIRNYIEKAKANKEA